MAVLLFHRSTMDRLPWDQVSSPELLHAGDLSRRRSAWRTREEEENMKTLTMGDVRWQGD
jgi:hypothetical protein